MATIEGLPDPSQVSSADAAARLAAAQAANLAYTTNTAPVLPVMGAGSVSGITQAEQADAAREAAKHAAAFHPAEYYGVNPASLGNVPLSQIASRYGTGFADIVQGYYTQNPTAEARAITAQYNAQHAIAENPFNPDSAAGIAWEVARTTGGAGNITESMKKTAGIESRASYGVDIFQGMSAVKGVSTVPTRLTGSGMIAGMPSTAQYITPGEDVYMAIGGYQGVRVPGAKIAVDYATGEFGVYAPRTPGSSAYSLIGGGGRYSAQSGMFSIGKSLWDTEHTFDQSQIGGMQPVSEAYMATHSKAGAEAYGGISRALNGNLLTPNEQISRYYGEGSSNLANFAAQIAGGKSEAPGANIPWSISASSPTMQYMNETGIVSGDVKSATGQTIGEILGSRNEGRLVGSKVIAGSPTYGTTEAGAAGLPSPYISASTGVIAPTGEVSIDFFGNKATFLPAGIPVISDVVKFFQPQQQVTTTMVGETTLPTETRLVKTEYTPLKESVSFLGTTQKEIPGGIETTKYYEKTGGMEALSTYETTGGKQREFATVVAPIPKSSGLDIFEQKIRETPGLPSAAKGEAIVAGLQKFTLPQYTAAPELAVATAERVLPSLFGESTAKETIKATKEFGLTETIYAMAPGSLKGQYEMFHEHPTMSAISYGVGGVMGTVAKTGEGLYMAGRAGLAERAISQGGVWRAAEQVTGTVMSRAPQALAAMYSVDIAGRATEGFTNLSPATAIPKARAIVTQEAYPMMLGFEAPSSAVRTVKTAEIGYKAAVQEGTAGGRLEYYVKQPVTKPYELAKQDYAAYLQENKPTTQKPAEPGLVSYAQYKAERAVRSAAMPFQAFAQEAPGKITSAISTAKAVPSKIAGVFDQPYAVEATRGYYPYAGIEKAAYPKTAGTKLPSAQDVLISGYSGYYGARATAIEKATSFGTAIKGGAARAASVVSGESGVTVGVKPEPLGETLLNVFYTPRLGKVVAPSTFGETKPIGGFITATVGGAGAEVSGKPAWKPPAPQQFRKTSYGTGLAKEPSLKSMGVSERAASIGKSTLRGEQVTDFRGKPISERMKPMERGTYGPQGAQAAGQPRLLMEELPKVEGMTQGRVSPQEMRFVSGAPSLQQSGRTGVVQVTEPSLAFTQERRQQQFARVIPVVSVTPAAMVSSAVESRTWQGVSQAARQAQITSVIPSFGQTTEARTTQASRQASTRDYTRDLITTPIIRTGLITSFTPFQTTDTRTTQTTKTSQITETKPYKDTWTKPWGETFIERGGGGGAWPGGASGATPGRHPRRAAFMETFMMGLDVGFGMGGRRPRAKSFTTPKKYKTKPAAKKKAGKK
jgi:hypothetical protein